MKTRNDYYVYFLKDSLTEEIFYVGKGRDRRAITHLKNFKRGLDDNPRKTAKINSILNAGGRVETEIFQSGLTEEEAYKIERGRIKEIGLQNLTNIAPGQMSEVEYLKQYAKNLLARVIPFWFWSIIEKRTELEIKAYWVVVRGLERIAREGETTCLSS